MKLRFLSYGAWAILALAGCSTTAQAPAGTTLTSQDLDDLTVGYQLVQFDLLECGSLQGVMQTPAVSAVTQKLCADAARYQPVLAQLAQAHDVTLPNDMPANMKARYVAFHYAPNATQFLRDQVSSHEDALAVFQGEASSGSTPDIRTVAAGALPVVQGNLDALRQALGSAE